MTTEQLITEIETKIQETQNLISNYKQELISKENTLTNLLKELNQIKKNKVKNTKEDSPQDSKQTK